MTQLIAVVAVAVFTGALEQAISMKTRTTAIRRALVDSPAEIKLLDEAVGFDRN